MQPVTLEAVARNWLWREHRKPVTEFTFEGMEPDWQLIGTLFCEFPFQAAFIWRYHVSWYRTVLDEGDFRRLRVIEGPDGESWRKLSPDDTILGAAERIISEELTGRFEDVDVDYIRRRAVDFTAGDDEFVTLFRSSDAEIPYVVDGNHYATAKMIALLEEGTYSPQRAHLGVESVPRGEERDLVGNGGR